MPPDRDGFGLHAIIEATVRILQVVKHPYPVKAINQAAAVFNERQPLLFPLYQYRLALCLVIANAKQQEQNKIGDRLR
jgi:hypothetical protein